MQHVQAAKTSLHEAAHVTLHAEEDHNEYVEHRGIKETEAESVAYVVAGLLGTDTSRYSIGYVAGWSKGDGRHHQSHRRPRALRGTTLTEAITDSHTPADPA